MVVLTVPKLQIGLNVSRKLCLNLLNRRWPNFSLSLVISFKPQGLWHCKVLFAEGLMKPNMRFLKSGIVSEFLTLESELFHSIIVEVKKQFSNSYV